MAAPTTIDELLDLVRKSGVVDEKRLEAYLQKQTPGSAPNEIGKYAGILVRDGVLTQFQAEQFLLGKWRRFSIGKYKVLERIGAGGMGSVYLCEHKYMRRRVAVKVLPTAKADEASAKERFYREARAVAALDHPNIVRAYDIDEEDNLHFLVMEYIDGSSLQDIVKRHGPLEVARASHYIRQAAAGLQHAHESAGLVHRDIKPGNILVDRNGVVKVLDMGLARFFNDDEEAITKKYDENVLGTADYLAPEQAQDSHSADIRADIYSLGATFYFCLTGNTPFNEGTVAQKLIWHVTRQPKPVRSLRADVPEGLEAIVDKMMAKDRDQRYQTPGDVVQALAEWTKMPIGPPPEREMPRLSPAAMGSVSFGETVPPVFSASASGGPSSDAPKWAIASSSPSTVPSLKKPPLSPTPKASGVKSQSSVVIQPTAPARRAAAPRQATAAMVEANPWENLAPETTDVTAHLDTAPHPPAKRQGPGLSATKLARTPPWKNPTVIAVAIGSTVLVAFLVWWLAHTPSTPNSSEGKKSATLNVARMDHPNAFKSVREALARAHAGDRIVVMDDEIEETLSIDGGVSLQGVTIEAGNAAKHVSWLCPEDPKDKSFLSLGNAPGLTIRGFTFDAKHHVPDLIAIKGSCPGLLLDDLELRGFGRHGVSFWNCSGKGPQEPVTLRKLRLVSDKDVEAALAFRTPRGRAVPPINQNIRVTDCRFEGPCQAAVQLASPILDLELHGNRIGGCQAAILYAKAIPRFPLQIVADSNTIYEAGVGFEFQSLPLVANSSQVIITNNLFGRMATLARVDDNERLEEFGQIVKSNGNVRDTESKDGNVPVAAQPIAFKLPMHQERDAAFLRYPKTDPLAQVGVGRKPVGAPPME